MAANVDEVKAQVLEQVEAGGFVQRLAERVGTTARASAVFGDAVERDGVTVIPVASAVWGFGGGSGGHDGQEGSGGGGGSLVRPLGYIEVRDGGAEFKSFRDPAPRSCLPRRDLLLSRPDASRAASPSSPLPFPPARR